MDILSDTTDNIEYIYHLADIHIKNNQERRKEYDIVLDNLIETIRSINKEGLIVICGDIFDCKNRNGYTFCFIII